MALSTGTNKLTVLGVELTQNLVLNGRRLTKIVDIYCAHWKEIKRIPEKRAKEDLYAYSKFENVLNFNQGVVIKLKENWFEIIFRDTQGEYWLFTSKHIVDEEPIPKDLLAWVEEVEKRILAK